MKSFKTEEERKNSTDLYFMTKHLKNSIGGFLEYKIKLLIKNGYSRIEAVNFIKDITESLKQEKIFTEE